MGTNRFVRLELTPVIRGTNQVLEWTAQDDSEAAAEQGLPIQIVNFSPAGSFVVATKVAFYGGLVLAAPFIFYFVAHFVFPALKMREKKYIYRGLAFAGGLFMAGVCFCYFILMPVALTASVQYAEWLGFQRQPVAGGGLRGVCLQVHAGHGPGLRVAGGGADAGEDWRAELSAALPAGAM